MNNTFEELKESINNQITENNVGAITGPVLNGVLQDIVSTLGTEISNLSGITSINIKGSLQSVDELDSITNKTIGDAYIIDSYIYVYNGTNWVNIGSTTKLLSTVTITIPIEFTNGISYNNSFWYTNFGLSEDEIKMIKSGEVTSVNVIDNFNTFMDAEEPTYAVATIAYNAKGNSVAERDATYGQITISYGTDGKIIIYDIYLGYSDTKCYVSEAKNTNTTIEKTTIVIQFENEDDYENLIENYNDLINKISNNTKRIVNIENSIRELKTNINLEVTSVINNMFLDEEEAESIFNEIFKK